MACRPRRTAAGRFLGPGKHSGTLEHDGLTRGYDVHVPQSYQAGHALPLVFYLHPLGMSNGYLQGAGNNPQKADDNGFIAVFPSGEGASWNAGACCGPSNGAGSKPAVDDVGFLRALLAQLSTELCIDAKRVYATGFSNGGFMSHRLACEAADIIAAIAPVSAVNGMTSCKPTRPVPVLMLNGTQDNLVPYQGGFGFPGITNGTFIGAQQTFQDWATRNGCTGSPQVTVSKGKATCHSYASCQGGAEVTLCTLDGAGHCWFGEMFCFLGTNSADVRATDLTWDFLRRFHLP